MQFFLYLVVGGLSFFVDIGVFVLLRMAAMPVIPASIVSFIAATGANYVLSTALAFKGGRFRRRIELARFLGVVLVGLVLNTALVWCFVYPLGLNPTVAKINAVPIVLVWNYLGRRLLVFHAEIPAPVSSWFARNFKKLRGPSILHDLSPVTTFGCPRYRSVRKFARATAARKCPAARLAEDWRRTP